MIERRKFLKGIGLQSRERCVSRHLDERRAIGREALRSRAFMRRPGLSFAAIFLADHAGLWAKNGLEAELKQVQGGPLAMVALTNREASFAGVASTDPVVGWDKGIKTHCDQRLHRLAGMQITAHKDWLSRVGVSPKSPLEDKLKAFKGARVGASTIAGGPAQYTRYLARTVGIDPERDMKFLAVGFGAARMAALRTNQVDVTVGSAPDSDQVELEGFGELFLDCTHEVPMFKEFPYTVAVVTPQFADEQPDLVRRIAQTLGSGQRHVPHAFRRGCRHSEEDVPNIPGKGHGARARAREGQLSAWRPDDDRRCGRTTSRWRSTSR